MPTVGHIGENALISRLQRFLPRTGRDVIAGIGDDCAVVRMAGGSEDLLLTSDPVIEGVHFMPTVASAAIGHKALARVVSDIAAMGGTPRWALVDLVAPRTTPAARLEGIYRGMARLARNTGVAVVGGDTSAGSVLELHLFAVGGVPRGRAVLRSGARAGDLLYVTGALGGSQAGRHLTFAPRLREGAWLGAGPWATAMMDLSDGLATDLPRLLSMSRVGAVVDAGAIPIATAARTPHDGRTPLEHALGDGEDFELLFTVRAGRRRLFEPAWRRAFPVVPCTMIGRIEDGPARVRFQGGDNCRIAGFEHFR